MWTVKIGSAEFTFDFYIEARKNAEMLSRALGAPAEIYIHSFRWEVVSV